MRRYIRQCADFAKWTLVIAMVTATLLLLAGRFLVNQLADYQLAIQQWLSDYLAAPVTASQVSGSWKGALPRISLTSARIGGEAAFLTMDSMVLEPDYLRSLLHRTLVVREMEIGGLALLLRETSDGRWRLGSLTGSAQLGNQPRTQLLNSLSQSRRILIRNTQVELEFFSGRRIDLQLDEMRLENSGDFHRLVTRASVDSDVNRASLVVELGGEADLAAGALGRAYLEFDGSELDDPLAMLFAQLGIGETAAISEADTHLQGEVWFAIQPGWLADFSGRLALANLDLPTGTDTPLQISWESSLAGTLAYGDESRIDLVDPVLTLNQQSVPVFDFSLRRGVEQDPRQLRLATDRLEIGELYAQLRQYDLLQGRLAEVLAMLNPRGTLRHLQLALDITDPFNSFLLRGNLQNVDLDAFVRAPAVTNLSGYFETKAFAGFVQVEAEQVAPHYEAIYDQPLQHDWMRGKVAWSFDRARGAVQVFADDLAIGGTQGEIFGAFRVEAPSRRGAFPTDLTLEIGLANSSAEHWRSLVPSRVPQVVRDWLDAYLGDGRVPEAAFLYRGKIQGTELERNLQLRLAMTDSDLRFARGWPGLTGVDADLGIDNANIRVTANRARLDAIDVSGARIDIDTRTSRIAIDTAFVGPGNQILNLLRQTPVRNRIGAGLDGFDLSGELGGHAQLSFPLQASFPREALQAEVEAELQGNELYLANQRLQLTDIQGLLHYDDRGLRADAISAQLWSEPLMLSIRSDAQVEVQIDTQVPMLELGAWLQTDWLAHTQGRAPLSGTIRLGGANSQGTNYEFQSSLEGVSSDLPAPLNKTAEQPLPLTLRSQTFGQRNNLEFRLGDLLQASIRRQLNGPLEAVSLGLGADAPALVAGRLSGLASLADLQVEEWTHLLSGNDGGGVALNLDPRIEISTKQTHLGGRDLGAVHAVLSQGESSDWQVDFAATWGQGIYQLGPGPVPTLQLSHLDLAVWRAGEPPAQQADPRTLPHLRVGIDDLRSGERRLGNWTFEMLPVDTGVQIRDLNASIGNIRVIGAEQASRLLWTQEGDQQLTQLDLSLEFANLVEVFALINQPALITSQSGSFYSSFAWPGSPTQAVAQPMSGILGVRLQNGEFATQEGVGTALMRVIGLFNINSWARRLQFDFSDLTARGTRYDSVRGDFVLDEGVLSTLTPVDARLTSGRMRFDGQVDLNQDRVDAQLVATLPLRENMTWVTGLVAGLPAAAGVWLIGKLFQEEVDSLTSVSYRISGAIDDPDVRTGRVFESTIRDN